MVRAFTALTDSARVLYLEISKERERARRILKYTPTTANKKVSRFHGSVDEHGRAGIAWLGILTV